MMSNYYGVQPKKRGGAEFLRFSIVREPIKKSGEKHTVSPGINSNSAYHDLILNLF